jgi:hypothetical protein
MIDEKKASEYEMKVNNLAQRYIGKGGPLPNY